MKKYLLLFCIFIVVSCAYRKDAIITSGFNTEPTYMIRIFAPSITNVGAVKIYSIPMENITDKKVDSLNREADNFIRNCEKYTNN